MDNTECQNGLLSIIVPVYKVEPYLDRCVESLVNQTYRDLEIILVDDGSPDNCPALCDLWAERDSRIRVIHKKNGGLSDARNTGISAAKGEYLAFVDSDDYVDFFMYETMIRGMEEAQAEIACCGRYIVKGDLLTAMHSREGSVVYSSEEAIRELLTGGTVEEATWDKVYRHTLFNGIRFPVGEINEDIVVVPRLLGRANRIVHVGKPFYYYWQNSASITRSAYTPKKMIILKHLDEMDCFLRSEYPNLLTHLDALQAKYCQSLLYLLLDNQQVLEENKKDYQQILARFRKKFMTRLRLERVGKDEVLKGCLIYCRLYYYLHKIKKRRG